MKICVFGATGKTGQKIVTKALKAGHQVIAVARNPTSLSQSADQLTVVTGDVLKPESLSVFSEHSDIDHVVIAVGSKALKGDPVRSEGTQHILTAMNKANLTPKVSLISAAGCHESWQQLDWLSKLFAKLLLPAVMREHEAQEKALTTSGLPFTIFRPSGLADKKPSDAYQIITQGKMKPSSIERQALAACIVEGFTKEEWLGKKLTVTGV